MPRIKLNIILSLCALLILLTSSIICCRILST
nr:MAG TPA: Sarcoglycan alpha/epsilon [Caudoviricetes sp.]